MLQNARVCRLEVWTVTSNSAHGCENILYKFTRCILQVLTSSLQALAFCNIFTHTHTPSVVSWWREVKISVTEGGQRMRLQARLSESSRLHSDWVTSYSLPWFYIAGFHYRPHTDFIGHWNVSLKAALQLTWLICCLTCKLCNVWDNIDIFWTYKRQILFVWMSGSADVKGCSSLINRHHLSGWCCFYRYHRWGNMTLIGVDSLSLIAGCFHWPLTV